MVWRCYCYGCHYGLVQGYADQSFRPNAQITREEMSVMGARALRILQNGVKQGTGTEVILATGESTDLVSGYADGSQLHSWSQAEVELMLQAGIMQGQSKDKFAPASRTTRAEAAAILSRLLAAVKLLNP
ncbi:S-layer homology domain-containing protein [Paenibacillus lutimineralis]|uniref:S-layer homology domain-containing protein n=1 Tax=Paenibacillus lutimineralis TaxID=2707005 RepID=A0A3S9V6H4_9BACL|nr:S-layer homology domain-containing protein [Paenibacillus lutimineralis]AZS18156.1 S-layer homology domain-containing protein [Paenibacillus lutimineralis]